MKCPRCRCKLTSPQPAVRAGIEVIRCPSCLWVGEQPEGALLAVPPTRYAPTRYVPTRGSTYDLFGYARRLLGTVEDRPAAVATAMGLRAPTIAGPAGENEAGGKSLSIEPSVTRPTRAGVAQLP